jgi:hypothetical protein
MATPANPDITLAFTAEQAHALIASLKEQNSMLQQQIASAPAAAAALAAQTAAAAVAQVAAAPRAPSRTKIPAASNYAGSALALDNWLREMQQQFEWYGYNGDAERVAMAAAQLRGSALDWWHALEDKQLLRSSFAEFEQALRKRFQPVDSAKTARLALDQLTQGAKQSVHDYTTQFRRLLTAASSMSTEDRVHRYVQGLRPAVRSLLLLQDVKTLDDAITSAARIGSLGQYASHAAGSSGPSSSSPMDLSVMQDLFALTGAGSAPDDHADSEAYDEAAPSDAAPVTRAELRQMHQQLLNAMQHQRRGDAGSRSGRGGRPSGRGPPRVAGLSEQQVRERLEAGACFACGKTGHRKADCPTARKQLQSVN